MGKIKRFIKNYKFSIPTLILVLIIAGAVVFGGGKPKVQGETIVLAPQTVSQEVDVTGRVRPAEDVALSVQSGGRVSSVAVKVGQEVTTGQILVRVDSADLQVRLARQQAALAKARLAFEQGTAATAQETLAKTYEDGFNAISDTFVELPDIISEFDNIFYQTSYSPYFSDTNVRNISTNARENKESIGARFDRAKISFGVVETSYTGFSRNASPEALEAMLAKTYTITKTLSDIVKDTRTLVKYVKDNTDAPVPDEIDRDLATLDEFTSSTNGFLSEITRVQNAINESRRSINNENRDTQISRIDIEQAELDIQDILVQINNRTIKSPVNGIVTDVKAKVGESISASTPVVSVISANQFEIEANVPEADMAKIILGAETDVTLDAYGSDVVFKATVTAIDPAETVVDGVATYKTTFQFVDKDDRIKSGMTANLIVKGQRKDNVLAVPQRAVFIKNGNKYVQVQVGEVVEDKPVQTGLRGSNGSVEIISGLTEGDKVIVFSEGK